MTNEYKLVQIEPTDDTLKLGMTLRHIQENQGNRNTLNIYKARLKDAPTLVEVDIDTLCLAILHDWNKGVTLKNALLSNLQKHGKLYAVKENDAN